MAADGECSDTVVPPYRRIADDVRHRIAAGDLEPGDQVPSARRITQEWGVAIATATKALALLRQDGLTLARPGIGTVVAEPAPSSPIPVTDPTPPPTSAIPPRRRRGFEGDLTRRRIVATAMAIADADGMAEVSMRRIAADLGVATMSLYRYVPTKSDLVLQMIDAAFGENRLPARPPSAWRARLEYSATAMWDLFQRHPWLAPVMSLTRPQLSPNALAHTDWVLGSFKTTTLSLQEQMYVHVTVFSFVRGIATALEPEARAEQDSGQTSDEWMDRQLDAYGSRIPGGLPSPGGPGAGILQMAQEEFDFDLDRLFRFGLDRLLEGLTPFVEANRAKPHRGT